MSSCKEITRFKLGCDLDAHSVLSIQMTNNRSNGILITAGGSSSITGALNRVTATADGVGIFIYGANVRVTLTDTVPAATTTALAPPHRTVSNNAVGIQ